MHDQSELERLGVPGVMIASSEFADAAEVQGAALGFSPARVFVPHPIQDRTDEELRDLADAAFDEVLRKLTDEGV